MAKFNTKYPITEIREIYPDLTDDELIRIELVDRGDGRADIEDWPDDLSESAPTQAQIDAVTTAAQEAADEERDLAEERSKGRINLESAPPSALRRTTVAQRIVAAQVLATVRAAIDAGFGRSVVAGIISGSGLSDANKNRVRAWLKDAVE